MKKNLLVIGDTINLYYFTEAIFKGKYSVFFAETDKDALSALEERQIHLMILMPMMRGADSFRFLEALRASGSRAGQIPVFLVGPLLTPQVVARANKAGVAEVMKLPLEPTDYALKVEELLYKFSPARERPDPVTGLPKKQMGEAQAAEMLNEGKKGALLLIELDHYSYASTDISDEALVKCRDIIRDETDDKAVFSVLKGGGFLLFVPGLTDRDKIENYAARLIRKILGKMQQEKIYVSVGLAVSERHGKNYEDLYMACDKGLGVARTNGKNIAKFYNW